MAVLAAATASGQQLYAGTLTTTTTTTLYTAPANNANVTSPSATAYIKEIVLANTTGTVATVTLAVGGVTILGAVSVAANDTKFISGINTMIPASGTITGGAGTGSAINAYISGVVVQ